MIIRIGVVKKSYKSLSSINVNIYTIDVNEDFTQEEIKKISTALINSITEEHYTFIYNDSLMNFQYFDNQEPYNLIQRFNTNWSLEIGLLPGMTDNIGNTAKNIISELLGYNFDSDEGVYTSQVIFSRENPPTEEEIAKKYNPLTQYCKLSLKNQLNPDVFYVRFFGNQSISQLNSLYSSPNSSIFIIPYVRHKDIEKKNI